MAKRLTRVPYRVMLDSDLYDGLKSLQARTDATIAASIRRAVRLYLEKQGELKPRRAKSRS